MKDNDNHLIIHHQSSCPVCHTQGVSLVSIDSKLPAELKSFFLPIPKQIDLLTSAGKFQYCSLIERLNYLKGQNVKLNDKVKKQKQLLCTAKEELTHLNSYKGKVSQLENEIQSLRQKLNSTTTTNHKSHDDFDFSDDDDDIVLNNISHGSNSSTSHMNKNQSSVPTSLASNTFIEKIHKQSSQRVVPSVTTSSTSTSSNNNNNLGYTNNEISPIVNRSRNSFFAESTKIGEIITPLSTGTSRGTTSSMELTPRQEIQQQHPHPHPHPHQAQHSYPQQNNRLNRISKTRSLTSQLASRISSHMKVASLSPKKLPTYNRAVTKPLLSRGIGGGFLSARPSTGKNSPFFNDQNR
ncbi:hypothetical protein DFJ63DRAFT_339161 [Scheffersomyces coipomensis]|uniref:uncharacterized protein n=1 Tax=Scheffersomyces coipomensis TaxID=1788519 RepID=UPI00315CBE79